MSAPRTIQDALSVKGRRAIITGGSVGIGLAFARALVESGASVVITGRREPQLEAARAVLLKVAHPGARVVAVVADVTKREDDARTIEAAVRELGGLDVLVNNAGFGEFKPISATESSGLRSQFELNVFGLYELTKLALVELRKSSAGRVINLASIAGSRGVPGGTVYNATKAAVIGFTRALAVELASDPATRHITANTISPGPFRTELFETVPKAMQDGFISLVPLQRAGDPFVDLAAYVVLLASDAGGFTTGAEFVVDGGATTKL